MQIEAARQWYTQPWKVAGGSKTLWYARFEAVRDAERKAADKMKRDYEAKRNRK